MTYAESLRDPRWQRKRLEILDRDGWACRECGATTRQLQVDHRKYQGEAWDVPSEFLVTLCDQCHENVTEQRRALKEAATRFDSRQLAALLAAARVVDAISSPDAPIPITNEIHASAAGAFFGMSQDEVTALRDDQGCITWSRLREAMVLKRGEACKHGTGIVEGESPLASFMRYCDGIGSEIVAGPYSTEASRRLEAIDELTRSAKQLFGVGGKL